MHGIGFGFEYDDISFLKVALKKRMGDAHALSLEASK